MKQTIESAAKGWRRSLYPEAYPLTAEQEKKFWEAKNATRPLFRSKAAFLAEMERLGGPPNKNYLRYHEVQFSLLHAGVRDGRISDNAIIAWQNIGLSLYPGE